MVKKEFSEKQLQVIRFRNKVDPKITVLHGAIRSGKTYLALLLWWRHMMEFRDQGNLHFITGYTIGSLRRNVLEPIREMFGINTTLDQYNTFTAWGNKVACFGSDNANAFKAMRGGTAHSWYANEVTLQHHHTVTEAIGRCSGDGARIIMDTNPSWPKHHIMTDYIEHSGEMLDSGRMKLKAWHFTIDDNPFLNDDYVQLIKETTPQGFQYDRDILGRWVTASGVVWPGFREDSHVVDSVPEGLIKRWYGGVDFGFKNPFVYLLAGVDGDGRLYIVKEHYKDHMLIGDHAKAIKDYNGGRKVSIVSDHAAQERAELHACGIRTNAAQKEVRPGIQAVAKRLQKQKDGRPRLFIHKSCQNTIREMGLYCWKEPKDGVNEAEEPEKVNDHCPDAVRYIVMHVDKRPVIIG